MPRKKRTKKTDAETAAEATASETAAPEKKPEPSHTHKDPKVEIRYGIPVRNR